MKMMLIAGMAFSACSVFAAPAPAAAADSKQPHPKMSRAEMEAARYRTLGGFCALPGSQKGRIMFLNAQKQLPRAEIEKSLEALAVGFSKFDISVKDVPPGTDFAAMKTAAGADVAVVVVSDDTTPILLAAPEDSWSAVNVKKLDRNLKTPAAVEQFYASRCRKELLRGFAAAAGGLGSTYASNVMNISRIEDLDSRNEFMPFDKFDVMARHLKSIGVRPAEMVAYRKAIMDGWAPAPTDTVQKVIYDKMIQIKAKRDAGELPAKPAGKKKAR